MSGFLVTGALLEDTGEITASASPVVLTPSSATILKLSGEGQDGNDQILRLPNASNLQPGVRYYLANRSGVPAEVQDNTTSPFARVEPGFEGEFRLLESGVWDASIYPSVKVGTEDLSLNLVSSGMWSWVSSQLSVSADAFVHIPGLPTTLNKIAKFPSNAIIEYTIPADVASSLAGTYVYINLPNTVQATTGEGAPIEGYYLWFKVGSNGDDPAIADRVGYMVQIAQGDMASTVATAVNTVLTTELSTYLTSAVTDDKVTITYVSSGLVADPMMSDGFSFYYPTAQKTPISLTAPGDVAYVRVRRSTSLPSVDPLEVFTSTLEALDTSDPDLFVVAQNIGFPIGDETSGYRVLIGNQLKLVPNQVAEMHASGAAKGVSGSIQYNRGDNVITADNVFKWDATTRTLFLGDLGITSLSENITLLDNQETPVSILSLDIEDHKNIVLEYSLVRDGNPQVGHIFIVHDGTEASIADNFVAISSLGIQFLASIEESEEFDTTNIVLSYKSSSTGHPATFRYSMRYWV
jgi:hypothetical protein